MGVTNLPEGYKEIKNVDLQKDRKTALVVNGIAIAIGVVMVLLGLLIEPIGSLFDMSGGFAAYIIRFAALFIGLIVYILLHEAVHGIFMKKFSGQKVKYGFTGLYAYAGSDAYFDRRHYIIIALAPIVIWGIALALLNIFFSTGGWFWVIYIIQIQNISGAAGDIYVSAMFSRLPDDILIKDTGVSMTVYSKEGE